MSRRTGTGDGDVCPINPDHGQMFFLTTRQWCPDHSHEAVGERPGTRAFWPQGHDSFRKAVITTTLPEIDIALLGG